MQLFRVGHGLGAGAHVGLGHDLQQRRAGAVQVDAAHAVKLFVQALARVFLQVRAHQAHRLLLVAQEEAHLAALHHRDFELADLVALGQIGVEVVLAGELVHGTDGAVGGQGHLHGILHHCFVQHRQNAWHAEAHRAGIGVGRVAEGRGAAAENLALGFELGMDLKADDGFKFHGVLSLMQTGNRIQPPVSVSLFLFAPSLES